MSDTLGVGALDGFADMETKSFGRNNALPQFSGMEAERDFRVDAAQVFQHAHVQVEIVHGNIGVFGHNGIDVNDARIGGSHFVSDEHFGEDNFGSESAVDLVLIMNGYVAAGIGFRRATVQDVAHAGFELIEILAAVGNDSGETFVDERLAHHGEISSESDVVFGSEASGFAFIGGEQDLEIADVLGSGAGGGFGEHVSLMGAGNGAE